MFKSTLLCLAVVLCMTISELKAIPTTADINTVVKNAIDKMDFNNDNHVDGLEFATFVDNTDVNDDGCINKDEFVEVSVEDAEQAAQSFLVFSLGTDCISPTDLKSLFVVMDRNSDGNITNGELKDFYKGLFDTKK